PCGCADQKALRLSWLQLPFLNARRGTGCKFDAHSSTANRSRRICWRQGGRCSGGEGRQISGEDGCCCGGCHRLKCSSNEGLHQPWNSGGCWGGKVASKKHQRNKTDRKQ